MQVVILAGGLGTRMRSVSADLPKALLPVAGRPFIEHQLALLAKHDLADVLLCIGHQGDQIEAVIGDGSRLGLNVRYAHEDPGALLGTGGALVNALGQIQDTFLVMYGDSYLPTDYRAVVQAFGADVKAMMCVFRNEGKWDKSNVRIDGGKVVFYSKEAGPGEAEYIDYGLSAFQRCVIEEHANAEMPLDLARIQQALVERSEMAAFEVRERFYEIGKPEGLQELREFLENG